MATKKFTVCALVAGAVLLIAFGCATTKTSLEDQWVRAARSGDADRVGALLEQGIDVDARTDDGTTALIYAATNGHDEIVKLLVATGANVDARDAHGYTALMYAVAERQVGAVRVLLDAGADPYVQSNDGRTAPIIAAATGNRQCIELMRTRMIMIARERLESSYLPFTVETKGVQELQALLQEPDIAAQSFRFDRTAVVSVPRRVRYAALNAQENETAIRVFFRHMKSASDMAELQANQPIIFGPYLTTLLKRGGALSALKHATVIAYNPGKQPFISVYVGINTSSISKAVSLVRNLVFAGGTVTVRPLNKNEMDWYWTIISWDIEEPVFVVESGDHTLMIDLSPDGSLCYVDLLDALRWHVN